MDSFFSAIQFILPFIPADYAPYVDMVFVFIGAMAVFLATLKPAMAWLHAWAVDHMFDPRPIGAIACAVEVFSRWVANATIWLDKLAVNTKKLKVYKDGVKP